METKYYDEQSYNNMEWLHKTLSSLKMVVSTQINWTQRNTSDRVCEWNEQGGIIFSMLDCTNTKMPS